MKKIIAEAELMQATTRSNLFFTDDRKRGLYMNLDVAFRAAEALKPYVGQIVTISVEVPEQLPCCSPDFEERVLEIVRDALKKV